MVYLVECSVVCVKSCEQFSFFSKSSLRWAKLPRENEVAPDYGILGRYTVYDPFIDIVNEKWDFDDIWH